MSCYQQIKIISLVTMMALLQVAHPCDHCDPDVPSRPPPSKYLRSKRESVRICEAGQFFNNQTQRCEPCEEGTFMTASMAKNGTHYRCEKCHTADKVLYEVEIEPCTNTTDTLILCQDFYFRKQISDDDSAICDCQYRCTPCAICGVGDYGHTPYEIKACYNYTDTTCCHHDNMVVVEGRCALPSSTVKPADTAVTVTRSREPIFTTTEPTTTHRINHCDAMFAHCPLLLLSFMLPFFMHSFSL